MNGFELHTREGIIIRFNYYSKQAPETIAAFHESLPFTQAFLHATVSGREIWTDQTPELDVIQENATVFVKPGEVVIGPVNPQRVKTAGCMGIYYGEGKGLDACNVFARVADEDFVKLETLGRQIWEEGKNILVITNYE